MDLVSFYFLSHFLFSFQFIFIILFLELELGLSDKITLSHGRSHGHKSHDVWKDIKHSERLFRVG